MNPSQLQPLETRHPPHRPSAFQSMKRLSAGGLAGIVAKSFVAPVDRIKILFQVTSGKFSLRQVWTVIKDISREEGPKGFFKGNSATMLRVFPYAGVQFFTYDSLKGTRLRRTAKVGLQCSYGTLNERERERETNSLFPVLLCNLFVICRLTQLVLTLPLCCLLYNLYFKHVGPLGSIRGFCFWCNSWDGERTHNISPGLGTC